MSWNIDMQVAFLDEEERREAKEWAEEKKFMKEHPNWYEEYREQPVQQKAVIERRVIIAEPGSIKQRNTVLSPDGWETVVPRNVVVKIKKNNKPKWK